MFDVDMEKGQKPSALFLLLEWKTVGWGAGVGEVVKRDFSKSEDEANLFNGHICLPYVSKHYILHLKHFKKF